MMCMRASASVCLRISVCTQAQAPTGTVSAQKHIWPPKWAFFGVLFIILTKRYASFLSLPTLFFLYCVILFFYYIHTSNLYSSAFFLSIFILLLFYYYSYVFSRIFVCCIAHISPFSFLAFSHLLATSSYCTGRPRSTISISLNS